MKPKVIIGVYLILSVIFVALAIYFNFGSDWGIILIIFLSVVFRIVWTKYRIKDSIIILNNIKPGVKLRA